MSRLPAVLLLVGSVITATSIDQRKSLRQTEESRVHHQSAHDILNPGSDHAMKSASSLDASTALNTIKSTGLLSGYFSTIVFDDDDCTSSSNVFGYGFLLGACVADYEFSTSTRREATETTVTTFSFTDTACEDEVEANPSTIMDYKEGVCILGEKQFLRNTIDIPLPGQSIVERYSISDKEINLSMYIDQSNST